ncbi:MAG: TolC family protein [Spirochaetia bacterium]|jgi:outer membrane protein TolC
MHRAFFFSVLFCAVFTLAAHAEGEASAQEIALSSLPGLVLNHDTTAAISTQTTLFALHTYKGALAQALPQIDFTTSYSLDFTPSLTSEVTSFTTSYPYIVAADEEATDQGTHLIGAKLSVSQLLPTAGSLFLSLEDSLTMTAIGSLTVNGGAAPNPGTEYSQNPKLSFGLTQPLFLNGKLLDLDVFPATLRKAQLGYLEQNAADIGQKNQTVGQAVQLFFSVVQLRKNVAQARKSIDIAQGNLDALQTSYALGSVAEPDLLDSQLGLSRQKQNLLELATTLAKTERLLAHSIGSDSLDGVPLADDVPALPFTMNRQQIMDKALSGHPLLLQKGLALEEKRVDKILAGEQYASSLTLSFSWAPRYPFDVTNYPYTATDLAKSFTDLFQTGWGQDYIVAAGLTIHLFDGGRQTESSAGNTALAAVADQGLAAQRLAVQDQVELDLLQKVSLEQKIALLADASRLADRRLATEQNLLALGKSTELEVASKKADADAKADDLWRARADLYLTVLDLYSLAGVDIAKIIEGNGQ